MRISLLLPLVLLAACGPKNVEVTDAGTPAGAGADAATEATPDSGTAPDAGVAENILTLAIGPVPLKAQEERTVCSRFKLPTTAAIDVTKLRTTLAPGSHHLILYLSKETTEQKAIYDCQALDIRGGDVPIYIAETESNNTLPMPTGVAYHLEPGQMVKLEAHYLNASADPVQGLGTVNMTLGTRSSYTKADIMFCGSVSPLDPQFGGTGVPPGKTTLPAGYFKIPGPVSVFGLTTHQHKRGSLMTLERSTGKDVPGTLLVNGTPYDNPPFKIYGDGELLQFGGGAGGDGIRWVCNYENKGTRTYYFGQSAEDNEMCFFWAYYFPSAGRFISNECLR